MAKQPAAQNAAEALAMARAAESPVAAYGYFIARDGKRVGDEALAGACELYWRALPENMPGPTDGVSAWKATDGTMNARITRTENNERTAKEIPWEEFAKHLVAS